MLVEFRVEALGECKASGGRGTKQRVFWEKDFKIVLYFILMGGF